MQPSITILATLEAQARGARGRTLKPGEGLLFVNVGAGREFVMHGVPYAIKIVFLDGRFRPLGNRVMAAHTGHAITPPGTVHALELLP